MGDFIERIVGYDVGVKVQIYVFNFWFNDCMEGSDVWGLFGQDLDIVYFGDLLILFNGYKLFVG